MQFFSADTTIFSKKMAKNWKYISEMGLRHPLLYLLCVYDYTISSKGREQEELMKCLVRSLSSSLAY